MAASQMPPGPGVDLQGRPVKDPSENVRELVGEVLKRQDDLREKDATYVQRTLHSENKHIREIVKMRAQIAEIRADHAEKLRIAEAGRIDAILVNVADTAKLTSAAAEIRATTLANQVTTSADTLRNQVADAAQASNDTLDRRFDPIQKSIEEIRRFQFETQGGKNQSTASSTHWGLWVGIAVAAFIGVNTLLLAAGGLIVTIFLTRQ